MHHYVYSYFCIVQKRCLTARALLAGVVGYPQVGATGIEDNLEVLGRATELDGGDVDDIIPVVGALASSDLRYVVGLVGQLELVVRVPFALANESASKRLDMVDGHLDDGGQRNAQKGEQHQNDLHSSDSATTSGD